MAVPEKSNDFLKFVELHEKQYLTNKERRSKEGSTASTVTANTTNFNRLEMKVEQIRLNRPFSGDAMRQEKKEEGDLVKRKAPFERPKTAKNDTLGLERSTENKLSSLGQSSHEKERQLERSNRLPEIIENSSRKSSTEYEYSSENSKEECNELMKPTRGLPSPDISEVKISNNNPFEAKDSEYDENEFKTDFFPQNKITKRMSEHDNMLEILKVDRCEMDPSERMFKESDGGVKIKDSFADCQSDLYTQLNLGSPVQNKNCENLIQEPIRLKPKRPSSAGNHIPRNDRHDGLSSNLLASTVGISRKGFCLNLASMLFSKPEVESNYDPLPKKLSAR
jgi:hypothetical protein